MVFVPRSSKCIRWVRCRKQRSWYILWCSLRCHFLGYTGITMSVCPSLHLCVQALSRRIFWTTQPVVTKPGMVVHDHETLFSTTVAYYHDTLLFLQVPRGEPHHRDWRSWKAGSASGASCGEPAPSSRGAASLWPSLAAVSCCELPPFFPHDYSERDSLPVYSTTKYSTLLPCDTTNVMPQMIQKVVLESCVEHIAQWKVLHNGNKWWVL